MQIQVSITDSKKTVLHTAEKGQTLKEILSNAGVFLDSPCGGKGKCGKCRLFAEGELSEINDVEKSYLTNKEINDGIRLGCIAKAYGNININLPEALAFEVETKVSAESFDFDPAIKEYFADNKYTIKSGTNIIDSSSTEMPLVGISVDIGTTTVVAYFYDLKSGGLIDTQSGLNEQRAWGADVISRISACIDKDTGLNDLQKAIITQLNGFINNFCVTNNYNKNSIYGAVIAGNTTMLHLAAAKSPNKIATAPFTPETLFGFNIKAAELGIDIYEAADIYFAPCVSAYVGGDITAGMLSCSMDKADKNTLFIDIGTNGEMTLKIKDKIICCSTAAGPAFEGAQIKFGTGGVAGAISNVGFDGNDIYISTINNANPVGICGSGLIDAIAVMLELGVIDETGRICDDDEIENSAAIKRLTEIDGEAAFILDMQSGICITQNDVRETQLAKSAIASGIDCLLHEAGITMQDVSQLILAGGFGAHINTKSACKIGLLPEELIDKIKSVGNAAGAGASQILLSKHSLDRLQKIDSICQYIELSGYAYFNERYVENMCFPY